MTTPNPFEVELLTQQYNSRLELLLQQNDTRLAGSVMTGAHVGKGASPIQYVTAVEFKQAGARGSDLQAQLPGYQRRWLTPLDKDLTLQVDEFDELRTIVDPKSALSASIVAAANRLKDDVIINAAFGSATIGTDLGSSSTETFAASALNGVSNAYLVADTFGAGATSVGMTVAKIIEGRRILRHAENDLEAMRVHLAIGSSQEADLLKQVEFVSTEYRSVPTYDDTGRLKTFLGCQLHFSERLNYASSIRNCIMWVEDGLYLGVWRDLTTIISQRNDKTGHPWQAYSMISLNASRLQPGKTIQINCADTTTGDVNP